MKNSPKIILPAVSACLLWSTAFFSIKIGLRYTGPLHLAGIRFMLAGIFVFLICSDYRQNFKKLWQSKITILKISFFQTFGLYSLFHLGMTMVPASVTALLIGAGPLFIVFLARIFNNEPLTPRKTVAIIVGFSGIAVISLGRFGGLMQTQVPLTGIFILLLANISGSIGNIIISKNRIKASPLFQNAIQLFIGGSGIYLLSLFIENPHYNNLPVEFFAAWIWLSVVAAGGFSLWFIVLHIPGVKVSEINIWKFIIPVFGAVFSWMVLPNEKPEPVIITGMVLVSLSLVIMYQTILVPGKSPL